MTVELSKKIKVPEQSDESFWSYGMDLGDGCGKVTETERTADVRLQCRGSAAACSNGSQSRHTADINLQSPDKIDNKNFS